MASTWDFVFSFAECSSPCVRQARSKIEPLLLDGKDMPELSKEGGAAKPTASTMGSTTGASAMAQVARKQMVSFVGHHAYLVTIARLNRESGTFCDTRIICAEGEFLLCHRLVLASCSSFLRDVFLSLPQGLPEYTLILPNIKKGVVETLLDFCYTGKMMLGRHNTHELQQLVSVLKIDPENVRIESEEKESSNMQSRILAHAKNSPLKLPTASTEFATNSKEKAPRSEAKPVLKSDYKPMPLRASKRRTSGAVEPEENVKTPKRAKGTEANGPEMPSEAGSSRLRRRPRLTSGQATSASASSTSSASGLHDMTDVETWVCALCHQYDPVLPDDVRATAPQTEWVGCDCNRWFHQHCTKLREVDDSFSCKMVNLSCLPCNK